MSSQGVWEGREPGTRPIHGPWQERFLLREKSAARKNAFFLTIPRGAIVVFVDGREKIVGLGHPSIAKILAHQMVAIQQTPLDGTRLVFRFGTFGDSMICLLRQEFERVLWEIAGCFQDERS